MTKLTDAARAKLQRPNFGYLAVEANGPHVSPIWVDTDGEYVIVNTAIGRVKERAMHDGARVALSIAEHDDPYDHVDMRGRVVRRVEDEEAVEHINDLHRKYHGGGSFRIRPGERRVKIWIEPTVIR